jgi:hypothetical protein
MFQEVGCCKDDDASARRRGTFSEPSTLDVNSDYFLEQR